MKKYNHAYTIAFSANSDDPEGYLSQAELVSAILARLNDLISNDEVEEACGPPFDTYENT